MFSTKQLTFALALILTLLLFTQAQTSLSCNPLTATCPANPGLATSSYFIDFTQQRFLPENWTLANSEYVTYGTNGAEFTFAKRLDAPYIWTDFYILFGHVEVVMQAAPGVGIISSAVLISDDQDEIDLEFSGNNFNTASGKVQTNYFGKGIIGSYDRGTYPAVDSPQTQFHMYALDWSPTTLTWSIDGMIVRTLSDNNVSSGSYQYPQSPMKLQIGLWDGGDASNAGGTVEWAGGYTDLSEAPFTMFVKSVKITNANPCSGGYQYTDMSGSYQSVKCTDTQILSSSNSTLPAQPNGSNQAGTATISSFLPASSSALPAANSSAIAFTSTAQSSAVVIPVQISYNTAEPPPMSSTVIMSSSNSAAMNSTIPAQVPSTPPFASTVTATTYTGISLTSPTQALASSSAQPTSTVSPTKTKVCTAPALTPVFPMSSTRFANSTTSTSPTGSATSLVMMKPNTSTSSSIMTTPPTASVTYSIVVPPAPSTPTSTTSSSTNTIPPTTSSTIPPIIFTGAANRLLPRRGWMYFFRVLGGATGETLLDNQNSTGLPSH